MTTVSDCEHFYRFLLLHYKLKKTVTVKYYPLPELFLEKPQWFVNAYMVRHPKKGATIHVAINRPVYEVFETIAHEYKHCLQGEAGIWDAGAKVGGFAAYDSPLEVEARAFATNVMGEYRERCRRMASISPPPPLPRLCG